MGLEDPVPTFSYVVQQLSERQPNLGFIHVIEPRTDGLNDRTPAPGEVRPFHLSYTKLSNAPAAGCS